MSDAAPEQPSRPPGWLSRFVPHRLGLRNRILLTFTLGVAVLAIVLAFTTYGLTRSTLLRQEEDGALDQAYRNARQVRATLRANPTSGFRRPGGRPRHRRRPSRSCATGASGRTAAPSSAPTTSGPRSRSG